MTDATIKPLTGRKVALMMVSAFTIIIAVNLTLAFQAVATFPGLETRNSYVSSQSFEADRAAQDALGWEVTSWLADGQLHLSILKDGAAVQPELVSSILGRATVVAQDQLPEWRFEAGVFRADVEAADGNWNLRLVARAQDGTLFRRRIIIGRQG